MKKADLILHPVRLRILTALMGRQMTAQALAAALPDVAQATLYRHINRLAEGGVLVVVEENPVRGTVEKVYALAEDQAHLSAEDMANLSKDDHMRMFTTFVTRLLHDFSHYLESHETVDPAVDGVGYQQIPLYLSEEELGQFAQEINAALLPYVNLEPTPQRRRRIFTSVMMPDDTPSGR